MSVSAPDDLSLKLFASNPPIPPPLPPLVTLVDAEPTPLVADCQPSPAALASPVPQEEKPPIKRTQPRILARKTPPLSESAAQALRRAKADLRRQRNADFARQSRAKRKREMQTLRSKLDFSQRFVDEQALEIDKLRAENLRLRSTGLCIKCSQVLD